MLSTGNAAFRRRLGAALISGVLAVGTVVASVVFVCLGVGTAAHADPSADGNGLNEELASTTADLEGLTDRAGQAVAELAEANEKLPSVQSALAEAKGRVVGAQTAARQAQREADAAVAVADAAARDFDAAVLAVEQARQEVASFVDAAYRGRDVAMLNAMLDSHSPSDFVDSLGYLQEVAESHQEAMDEFVTTRLTAKQRSATADIAKNKATEALEAAQGVLDAALQSEQQAGEAAASVQAVIDQQTAALATAESERAAVVARYEDLKSQSSRLAVRLRQAGDAQATSNSIPSARSSGFLKRPSNGYTSSPFGTRFHPVYHIWRMHTGIDIAAGYGTPIYAAADGTVVEAQRHGGYGNFTCVYHGKYQGRGLTTCYAHQSSIGVFAGQTVHRGDIIGLIGSTGVSTGNHLHFEVRLAGEPVDPSGWL